MKPDLQPLRALYRRSRAVRFAVELVLAVLVIAALGAWQTRGHARGALPPGALAALDGAPVLLASLRGKPVLVAVWAPGCTVCAIRLEACARAWINQ